MKNFAKALVLFSLSLSQCTKDSSVLNHDCNNLGSKSLISYRESKIDTYPPYNNIYEQYYYIYDSIPNFFIGASTFSPTNPNQFIYGWNDNSSAPLDQKLSIFDFCTGKSQMLANHVYTTNPSWSIKDWVLFQGSNHCIYKIKTNGDSLIQLTHSPSQYYDNDPVWNAQGTQYCYYSQSLNKPVLCDENGLIIKAIDLSTRIEPNVNCWGANNKIVFTYGDLYIYDLNNNSEVKIPFTPTYGGNTLKTCFPNYCSWFDSHTLLICDNVSIFFYDIISNQKRVIMKGGDSRFYRDTYFNSAKNKIIFSVIESKYKGGDTIEVFNKSAKIHIMDIDGGNDREVSVL